MDKIVGFIIRVDNKGLRRSSEGLLQGGILVGCGPRVELLLGGGLRCVAAFCAQWIRATGSRTRLGFRCFRHCLEVEDVEGVEVSMASLSTSNCQQNIRR